MTTHHLHLANEPFEAIIDGRKTIESRLYDEKRRQVSVGDELVFTNRDDGRELRAMVTELLRAGTWEYDLSELFTATCSMIITREISFFVSR